MNYHSIFLRIDDDAQAFSLQEIIDTNDEGSITEDDIARITALQIGESTHLEATHCGTTTVTRVYPPSFYLF